MKKKRSNEKRIGTENKVLRHMRQKAGMSFQEVGKLVHISGSTMSHMEHGRIEFPRSRIEELVKIYGCTMEDFYALLKKPEMNAVQWDDCVALIRRLEPAQLAALYGLLASFEKKSY